MVESKVLRALKRCLRLHVAWLMTVMATIALGLARPSTAFCNKKNHRDRNCSLFSDLDTSLDAFEHERVIWPTMHGSEDHTRLNATTHLCFAFPR